MKERIRQVMERTGLTQQDFANQLGISPASLSNIFVGRTNPTNNHVQAIHRAFPDINVSWLLFGEGEMLGEISSLGVDGAKTTMREPALSEELPRTSAEAPTFAFLEDTPMPSPTVSAAGPSLFSGQKRETVSSKPVSSVQIEPNTRFSGASARRIREIRVFFDDGTYEAFVPLSEK